MSHIDDILTGYSIIFYCALASSLYTLFDVSWHKLKEHFMTQASYFDVINKKMFCNFRCLTSISHLPRELQRGAHLKKDEIESKASKVTALVINQ